MRLISKTLALLSVLAVSAGLAWAAPAAAAGVPPLVGSDPQVSVRTPHPGTLTGVRVGRQATYDRVVFTVRGATPGWDVRYVSRVTADPSGRPVTVAGAAVLRVVLTGVDGHTRSGRTTVTGLPVTPRYPSVTQVKGAGDFEAVMTFAVGVTDRLDFRVFALRSPTRVVVDVAHPVTTPFTREFTMFWSGPGGGGDLTVGAIRTGGHPRYDRVVVDLPGTPVKPNIGVGYAGPMDQLPAGTLKAVLWTYTHANVPNETAVVSYTGPTTIRVGLPNVRTVTVRGVGTSEIAVIVSTRVVHGYRAFLLPGTNGTRLVIDVAR